MTQGDGPSRNTRSQKDKEVGKEINGSLRESRPLSQRSLHLTSEAKKAMEQDPRHLLTQKVNNAIGWSSDNTIGKEAKTLNHEEQAARSLLDLVNEEQRIRQFAEALQIDFGDALAIAGFAKGKSISIDNAQKVLTFAQEKGVHIADLGGENILKAWGDMSASGYYFVHSESHVAFAPRDKNHLRSEFSEITEEIGFTVTKEKFGYLTRKDCKNVINVNGWTLVHEGGEIINEGEIIKLNTKEDDNIVIDID